MLALLPQNLLEFAAQQLLQTFKSLFHELWSFRNKCLSKRVYFLFSCFLLACNRSFEEIHIIFKLNHSLFADIMIIFLNRIQFLALVNHLLTMAKQFFSLARFAGHNFDLVLKINRFFLLFLQ